MGTKPTHENGGYAHFGCRCTGCRDVPSKPEAVAEQERRGDLYDAIARSVETHGPAEVLWILGVILDDVDPDDPLAAPIAVASSSCFAGARAITGAAGAASDPEAERVRREALYGVLTRRSIL